MPGDTKVKRAPNGYGWIDIDNPTTIYRARWQARAARRSGHNRIATTPSTKTKWGGTTLPDSVQSITVVPRMSSLQVRLMDRLTTQQGVSYDDADDVVSTHGYNAAASYGHMRQHGATHSEALYVIDLGLPDVSYAYGKGRYYGYDHTTALMEALRAADDDD